MSQSLHAFVVAFVFLLLACAGPAPAAEGGFQVRGAVERPREWTLATVTKELPGSIQTVRFTMRGEEHTAKCVPLWTLIETARLKIDPEQKNHRAGFAVVVRARDGYVATFSVGELAPDIGNRPVWVALEMDGKPLPEAEGPVRLIVPGEGGEHFHRWIYGIESFTVLDGAKLGQPSQR